MSSECSITKFLCCHYLQGQQRENITYHKMKSGEILFVGILQLPRIYLKRNLYYERTVSVNDFVYHEVVQIFDSDVTIIT